MERTARVIIFALLFQLYPRVDEIDDVGSGEQVIDENAWDSSGHMPQKFKRLINENKPRIPSGSTALRLQLCLSIEGCGPQQISTDEYGVRFREPVSSRDVSQRKL